MKFIRFIVILWITTFSNSIAQDSQHLRVKANDNPAKAISFADRYRYPEFLQGKLIATTNNASVARFNYSLLLGEMHFIDIKGDTLAIANDPTIQAVTIGQDLFYYEYPKTYWLLLNDYESGKLMSKRTIILIDREKEGGYGQSTGTSSIRNTTTFSSSNSSLAQLNNKADMLFLKRDEYKLMDKNRKFYSANQSGFLNLFAKNKSIIKRYLTENPIDFKQETDLKKLLEFCTNLP